MQGQVAAIVDDDVASLFGGIVCMKNNEATRFDEAAVDEDRESELIRGRGSVAGDGLSGSKRGYPEAPLWHGHRMIGA